MHMGKILRVSTVRPTLYERLPLVRVLQHVLPLPFIQGVGQGTILTQGPRPMWEKIMQQPLRTPWSNAMSYSTKTSRRSHLTSQLTMQAGPLHLPTQVPLLWIKRRQIPPTPKTLHQQSSGSENQFQTSHNQWIVLAQNRNFPPITTVMSRRRPVQA